MNHSFEDIVSTLGAGTDSTLRLTEMFVDLIQKRNITLGQKPAERPVFRKLHGVAFGRFEPLIGIPDNLRVGVFGCTEPLPAWIRFSSDTNPVNPDLKSTLGIAIKLFGVGGQKAFGDQGTSADFILQNHPVFFVDNLREMCAFTYEAVVVGDYADYLARNPATDKIIKEMAKISGSVLTETYWGILPFGAGTDQFVKYRIDPEALPLNIDQLDPNYLAADIHHRLKLGDYRFRFMVQWRTNPLTMPLDRATVEWPEDESLFVQVATLTIPRQDVSERGQSEYGQGLDYNIFRVPLEQAPAAESSIATARKTIYAASAITRHRANGQSEATVDAFRAPQLLQSNRDNSIVRAIIYPAIGIARVGNSPDGWFIGPETPDPLPLPTGGYRDASGALNRQAARFRVYGVNLQGEIVRELTGGSDDVEISWSVELANTKAAWYGFQLALDIPEAASAPPTTLRNAAIPDRSMLAIRPGPRTLSGPSAGPARFDSGRFMGKKVYLGEIFTDSASRLLVLGGHGHSASYDGSWAITFANNEGWHDDVSDGPVTAEVTLNGEALQVVPAWVVVAPPNFGPQRKSVRTMWDLMRDTAVKAKLMHPPVRPSFSNDILPIFLRLAGLQWVNASFAAGFGCDGAFDLTSSQGLATLSDHGSAAAGKRRMIASAFRRFDCDAWSPKPWPWLYGDAMSLPGANTPRQYSTLSDLQLSMLDQWADGNFVADYDPALMPPHAIEDVPIENQGDVLTRAALEFCLADAFHPGCEMTWVMRASTMYTMPFRILPAPAGWIEPDFGQQLTSETTTVAGRDGPLGRQAAGGLTRWMAVPWQTDTASCGGGYDPAYDPFTPTFWPARVPNQVLTKEGYGILMDPARSVAERRAAFASRARWAAPLGTTSYTDVINNMIAKFDHLGVVEACPGPSDLTGFPAVVEVEDQHLAITDVIESAPVGAAHQGHMVGFWKRHDVDWSSNEKFNRFPGGLKS